MTNKNQQIGALVAAIRKEKGLTQAQLGELLHVTGKAVSKWENGQSAPGVDLLEPLADLLGVTVTELLAGRRMEREDVQAAAQRMALELLRRERRAFYRSFVLVLLAVALVLALAAQRWGPAIFQEGDPRPYLSALLTMGDQPCVQVKTHTGYEVWLTKTASGRQALFALLEERWGMTFTEQMGSGWIFSDGEHNRVVTSRVFWRYFLVWQVPTNTLPG